ncbi:peptidoglycan D,D-transpeptidase FtsI family protein [Crassaminicella profunda]|uniref:peptidoglycan D,D-transpeptidase FtsI family protein n=1 Tax=Crassaminicella profunda TaxID=1286698 RepID=UPI001CA70EB6|nr:penicillin-binding transpeptidase domain-containing protein [Crassaminicella profunda]QZY56998.1 peptidoglycan glycosyltransferase [Crassaminicella profunda]
MESRVDRKRKKQINNVYENNQKRIYTLGIIFTVFLLGLMSRLFYIQIVKGNDYYARAKNQWFKEIPVGIERGKIYDRNRLLLTNQEEKRYLVIYPEYFIESDENIKMISDITSISPYKLKKGKLTSSRTIKLEIKNDKEELIKKVMSIKGVYPVDYNDRYNKKSIAAHVIGYINKIDNIGEKGIEKMYDEVLKENQICKVEAVVDAQKKIIPGLGYKKQDQSFRENGKNIVTTLDYHIQKIAEEEFEKLHKNGSVVILDVQSGEILAMVSRPNFDQNNVAAYLKSNNKELYNRAVQIGYPPGSIFKIIVTAAALENKINDDDFFCKGYEEIGDTRIKCWSFDKGGHGKLNLEEAFAVSCNAAFIQLGEKIGGEKILSMAKKFGLGSKTNIGLYEEISGSLPSEEYMKGAGIGNISIGQGTLEVTPLQIAKTTAIIANDGVDKGVYLIKEIIDDHGKIIKKKDKNNPQKVISYHTAKRIQTMMEKVVSMGTARNMGLGKTSGKTGSAQAKLQGKDIVHAWFTGFFPSKDPKYVITIVVEDGISGGKSAIPIFKNIKQRIN